MDVSVLSQRQLAAIAPFVEQARLLNRSKKLQEPWRVRLAAVTAAEWLELIEAFPQ